MVLASRELDQPRGGDDTGFYKGASVPRSRQGQRWPFRMREIGATQGKGLVTRQETECEDA